MIRLPANIEKARRKSQEILDEQDEYNIAVTAADHFNTDFQRELAKHIPIIRTRIGNGWSNPDIKPFP